MTTKISIDGKLLDAATPSIFIGSISPSEAELLLGLNTNNRPLKRKHIANLVRDLHAGNWKVNGDAIRVSKSGVLLDGQHRLLACAEAGVPLETAIFLGADDEAGETIDQGAKRTAGDVLAMHDVPYAKSVASTTRALVGFADGRIGQAITISELRTVLGHHPGIIAAVDDFNGCNVVPSEGASVAAIYYAAQADGHKEKASAWRETWLKGYPSYAGDPAHMLRERFFRERGATVAKASVTYRRRLLLSAWRLFLTGRTVKHIKPAADFQLPGWSRARLGLATIKDETP